MIFPTHILFRDIIRLPQILHFTKEKPYNVTYYKYNYQYIMTNNHPKISVIIPLYNKAPYIKRTLDSVLNQTMQDFEVIVVNDGSKDGGEKIVEGYDDPRICLISQENQGVSAARNHGVEIAKSNLVAFLDADDEWLPDFLEKMLELHLRYPHAVLYSCSSIDSSSKSILGYKESKFGIINDYFRYCALHGHPINCSSVLIHKQTLQNIGGFNPEFKFYEDLDLWDRLAYIGNVAHIDVPLSIYHTEASLDLKRIENCENNFKIPFLDFIHNISEEDLLRRDDLQDICLYLDYLKILEAKITTYHNRAKSISIIMSVHSRELIVKKYKVLLYLLFPNRFKKPLMQIYNRCFGY